MITLLGAAFVDAMMIKWTAGEGKAYVTLTGITGVPLRAPATVSTG